MRFASARIEYQLPSDHSLRVVATRQNILTNRIDFRNDYNPRRIRRQAEAPKTGRKLQRILVAASSTGEYTVLDKRLLAAAASEANLPTLPAYVVKQADLQPLLNRYFEGKLTRGSRRS